MVAGVGPAARSDFGPRSGAGVGSWGESAPSGVWWVWSLVLVGPLSSCGWLRLWAGSCEFVRLSWVSVVDVVCWSN